MGALEEELLARAQEGRHPTTIAGIEERLAQLGYRLDRSMDCAHVARWMTGPRAGKGYPAISTRIQEIDTGIHFGHVDCRQDERAQELRKLCFEETLFAVVRGSIFEI